MIGVATGKDLSFKEVRTRGESSSFNEGRGCPDLGGGDIAQRSREALRAKTSDTEILSIRPEHQRVDTSFSPIEAVHVARRSMD